MYVFIFYFLVLENISTYVEQVNGSQVLVNVDQKSCKRLSIFSNKLVFLQFTHQMLNSSFILTAMFQDRAKQRINVYLGLVKGR